MDAPLARNYLLAGLNPRERADLSPSLELVRFRRGQALGRAGEALRHVYFPADGVVSLLSCTREGTSVEVGLAYSRGLVEIRDAGRLQGEACECYEAAATALRTFLSR